MIKMQSITEGWRTNMTTESWKHHTASVPTLIFKACIKPKWPAEVLAWDAKLKTLKRYLLEVPFCRPGYQRQRGEQRCRLRARHRHEWQDRDSPQASRGPRPAHWIKGRSSEKKCGKNCEENSKLLNDSCGCRVESSRWHTFLMTDWIKLLSCIMLNP